MAADWLFGKCIHLSKLSLRKLTLVAASVVDYRSPTQNNLNIMNDIWAKSGKVKSIKEKTTKL